MFGKKYLIDIARRWDLNFIDNFIKENIYSIDYLELRLYYDDIQPLAIVSNGYICYSLAKSLIEVDGIRQTSYDIPCMYIKYKNGTEECISCYYEGFINKNKNTESFFKGGLNIDYIKRVHQKMNLNADRTYMIPNHVYSIEDREIIKREYFYENPMYILVSKDNRETWTSFNIDDVCLSKAKNYKYKLLDKSNPFFVFNGINLSEINVPKL